MAKKQYSIKELQQFNTMKSCVEVPAGIPEEVQVAPETHITRIFRERNTQCGNQFFGHCLPRKPEEPDTAASAIPVM
ncbi:hypothetical protein [Legionella genomosp. 1]|uniref:hypothetical protein n=1 Tax=Legionella genomosp. 1 TaxID=1093625 RepID=UPI0010552060|nr:hypothetical protein [Legionella genomosp. 1]